MNRPVVANDHPEQKLVIDDSGVGLCVPYDEQAFSDAIVTLLEQPEMAEEMGRKGRAYVERTRSYERIADLVEYSYERICSNT